MSVNPILKLSPVDRFICAFAVNHFKPQENITTINNIMNVSKEDIESCLAELVWSRDLKPIHRASAANVLEILVGKTTNDK